MKKILFILLVTFSALFAGSIKWEKDYAAALKQAKALNKPMMFIISNHNCRYCLQLESTTLKDPKVIQQINSNYVAAIAYVDENPLFPRDLYVGGTPATWFIKGNGEPMFEPLMGAIDATSFLKALDIVSAEHNKSTAKK
jgi:thioredoxin-related protein